MRPCPQTFKKKLHNSYLAEFDPERKNCNTISNSNTNPVTPQRFGEALWMLENDDHAAMIPFTQT